MTVNSLSRSAGLLAALIVLASSAPPSLRAQDGFDFCPRARLVALAMRDTVWLVSSNRATPRRPVGQGGMPHFAPKCERLAYYSNVSGSRQLWVLDLRRSRRRQVTRVRGGIEVDTRTGFSGWVFDPFQYCWSPDGTRLVFTSLLPAKKQPVPLGRALGMRVQAGPDRKAEAVPLILTNTTPEDWTLRGAFRRDVTSQMVGSSTTDARPTWEVPRVKVSHLFITEVATGLTRRLTSDDGGYFNPDWSPDGTQVVAVALQDRSLEGWGPEDSDLCLFDVASGRRSCIGAGSGQKRLPRWSPDGQAIAYVGGAKFVPQSVYIVRLASGVRENVTASLDRPAYEFDWSPDGRSLHVAYQDGLETPIARVDLEGGKHTRIESNNVWPGGFGGFVERLPAWRQWPDGNSAQRIRVLEDVDSLPRTVAELKEAGPSPGIHQQVIRWKNSRGDEIEGLIVTSPASRAGRAPLLVNAYGGQWNVPPYRDEVRLANNGFLVFLPNHRAPHMWMNVTKNPAYDGAASGPQGIDLLHDDIMSGVDTLIARGLVDSTRMCVYGHSNGGLSALYLLMRTARFRCASVAAPATADWPTMFFVGGGAGIDTYMHGATPWSDPGVYVALSPVYHSDQMTTPLLLSVGDDDQVLLLATIGLYNGLRYLGRSVTLLRYAGQGHQLEGAAKDDFERRQLAFFREHLVARP
jgi:dipeptidyl aminopeptidase/acylaminoacyl peptidase